MIFKKVGAAFLQWFRWQQHEKVVVKKRQYFLSPSAKHLIRKGSKTFEAITLRL